MQKSINYKLSKVLSIVGIPMFLIAVLWSLFAVVSLFSDGRGAFFHLPNNEDIQGAVLISLTVLLSIVFECYYIQIGFYKIRLNHEMWFWIVSIALMGLFFLYIIYELITVHFQDYVIIIGCCYEGFFLAGSIQAVVEIRKLKRSVNQ
jgi:predicted neutral ceramidase superfamily lipid hydrolase